MTKLIPFADDAASVSIAKLTIENTTDRIALYGSLDLTRDRQGLVHARALKAMPAAATQCSSTADIAATSRRIRRVGHGDG